MNLNIFNYIFGTGTQVNFYSTLNFIYSIIIILETLPYIFQLNLKDSCTAKKFDNVFRRDIEIGHEDIYLYVRFE